MIENDSFGIYENLSISLTLKIDNLSGLYKGGRLPPTIGIYVSPVQIVGP